MRSAPLRRTVGSIYDAALVPDLWPAALQAVMDTIGAVGAGFCISNGRTGRIELLSLTGPLVNRGSDYVSYYHAIDPLQALVEAAPPGRWVHLAESVPAAVLRRNEWYNDFLLKAGIDDVVGTRLFESGSRSVLFGVALAGDRPPFAAADLAALQELPAPLREAGRLHAELCGMGWGRSLAPRALDQLVAGVMVTDGKARVIELNRAAERIVRRDDGLRIRSGRLEASGALEREKFARLIATAAAWRTRAAIGRMLVARRIGVPAYVLTVAPLSAERSVDERPLAMILVADPDELSPSERDLAEIFDLSPAESRLAAALMTGRKPL